MKKLALTNLTRVRYIGVDEIELTFDLESVLIKLLDDNSYIKIKKSIIKFTKRAGLKIEFEDNLDILKGKI